MGEGEPPKQIRKVVTVLFADVTGSTTLGERLDPETLREVMGLYFSSMKAIVSRYDGTVVDFIGDSVMAVFGIPRIHEDDAIRAVRAAWDMQAGLPALNEDLEKKWGVSMTIRVGVNTGVVSGDVTSSRSLVLGDAVNVAARLEKLGQPGDVLIGEDTYKVVRDLVEADPLESDEIRGKAKPVKAYRVLEVSSSPPLRRFDSPMVGRERESLLLQQAFERSATERSCHLFTVLGPAGVGKSRLVREFVRSLHGKARVLSGRCLAYGEGITYWPLIELMDEAAGLSFGDTPQEALAKLHQLVAGEQDASTIAARVAELVGVSSGNAAREESFWAVRRIFDALAADQPLVAILDDVHWAESTFLDLVEYVADWPSKASILIVCMARPDLLEMRPSWSGGKFNATSILMEPLDDDCCGEMAEKILGTSHLDPDTKQRIVESAEGNPLFVEELISMMIEEGHLHRSNGGWASIDVADIRVPPSIQALLSARLDRLTSEERTVIEAASVVGKEFTAAATAHLNPDSDRSEVKSHLLSLARKQLVHPQASAFTDEVFDFKHILIRDIAYEGMPKQVRAELHQRFAEYMEGTAGDRLVEYEEILAYHLEKSYSYRAELAAVAEPELELAKRAAYYLARAGRRALMREDQGAAANLLSRASMLLDQDDPERSRVAMDLASALVSVGDYAKASRILDEAADRAGVDGDEGTLWRARLERALIDLHTDPEGMTTKTLSSANEALKAFGRLGDEAGLALTNRVIAEVHWSLSQYAAAQEALKRGLTYARAADDLVEEMKMASWLPMTALWGSTPIEEGIALCREVLVRGPQSLRVECLTLGTLASLEAMGERFDESREMLRRARAIAEEIGTPQLICNVCEKAGLVETLAGNHAEAEAEYRRSYEIFDELGDRGWLPAFAAALAKSLCDQNKFTEAEPYAQVSEELAASDDVDAQIEWREAKARVIARRGLVEDALRLGREAVEIADRTDYLVSQANARLDLADVMQVAGNAEEARALVDEAIKLYEAKGNRAGVTRARELWS